MVWWFTFLTWPWGAWCEGHCHCGEGHNDIDIVVNIIDLIMVFFYLGCTVILGIITFKTNHVTVKYHVETIWPWTEGHGEVDEDEGHFLTCADKVKLYKDI